MLTDRTTVNPLFLLSNSYHIYSHNVPFPLTFSLISLFGKRKRKLLRSHFWLCVCTRTPELPVNTHSTGGSIVQSILLAYSWSSKAKTVMFLGHLFLCCSIFPSLFLLDIRIMQLSLQLNSVISLDLSLPCYNTCTVLTLERKTILRNSFQVLHNRHFQPMDKKVTIISPKVIFYVLQGVSGLNHQLL